MPSFLGLLYRTTDALKWGAGKLARLTSIEIDNNWWKVDEAIRGLSENPALPMEIETITVEGNQMTFTMSDGVTTFGPYTLPVASFNVTGPFQGNHDYARFDLIEANDGMYLVLQPHTSLPDFDPNDGNVNGDYYYRIFPFPTHYDVGFFSQGQPGVGLAAGETMYAHAFRSAASIAATDTSNADAHVASLETAPTADLSFVIYKNDTDVIGSIDFAAGNAIGAVTFDVDVDFVRLDRLRIIAPSAVDATAANLAIAIVAELAPVA